MFVTYGRQENLSSDVIGIAAKSFSFLKRSEKILIAGKNSISTQGYVAIIKHELHTESTGGSIPTFYASEESLQQIQDGDILHISTNGRLEILYKAKSDNYTVFMTNLCNSRCIMCPQSSEEYDPELPQRSVFALNAIPPKILKQIGITGGEPTLCLTALCEILNIAQKKHSVATISLLTNGRALSIFSVAQQISLQNENIIFGIPLYGATDDLHDRIVNMEGAFSETIRGIHNLYRLGQAIEIRIVLIKPIVSNLSLLSSFIYRNFPFVAHVTFMGAEYIGEAAQNFNTVWIEPHEYISELEKSVWFLHQRDINVSVYNLPLCLLSQKLKPFARDSISQWKKTFLPECADCSQQNSCAGIFSTSIKQSRFIRPI